MSRRTFCQEKLFSSSAREASASVTAAELAVHLLDLDPDLPQVDVEVLEHVRGDAAAFLAEAKPDMFGSDVLVVETLRLLLGKLEDFARAFGEFVEAISHV